MIILNRTVWICLRVGQGTFPPISKNFGSDVSMFNASESPRTRRDIPLLEIAAELSDVNIYFLGSRKPVAGLFLEA